MHLAGEAIGRQLLGRRVGVEESFVDALRIGAEHSVESGEDVPGRRAMRLVVRRRRFARRRRLKNGHEVIFASLLGELEAVPKILGADFPARRPPIRGFWARLDTRIPWLSVPRAGMEAVFKSRRQSAVYPPTNGSGGGKQPIGKGGSRCPALSFCRVAVGGDEEEVGVPQLAPNGTAGGMDGRRGRSLGLEGAACGALGKDGGGPSGWTPVRFQWSAFSRRCPTPWRRPRAERLARTAPPLQGGWGKGTSETGR
jgi:hypothetical protein